MYSLGVIRKRIVLVFSLFLITLFSLIATQVIAGNGKEKKLVAEILVDPNLKKEYLDPTLSCVLNETQKKLQKIPREKLPDRKVILNLSDIIEITGVADFCALNTVIRKADKIKKDFKGKDYLTVIKALEALTYSQAQKRLVVLSRNEVKFL